MQQAHFTCEVLSYRGPRGGRGDARPVPDLAGTSPCPREGGPEHPNNKGSVPPRSVGPVGVARPLKRHPRRVQHSAASWRDPGPSASGERLNRSYYLCAKWNRCNNFMWVALLSRLACF